MNHLKRKSSELETPGDAPMDHSPAKRVQHSRNKKKRPSFLGPQTMVKINVTNESASRKQSFTVYKEFICYHSPFFDAAFNGQFAEGKSQAMNLDDVEPEAFALLVNWLYAQKVLDDQAETQPKLATLADLWMLADRFLIPKLQNETLVAYDKRRLATYTRPSTSLKRIYKNTTPESLFRQYITRVVSSNSLRYSSQDFDSFPRQLLVDMIGFMGDKSKSRRGLSEEGLKQFFVKEEAKEAEAEEVDKL